MDGKDEIREDDLDSLAISIENFQSARKKSQAKGPMKKSDHETASRSGGQEKVSPFNIQNMLNIEEKLWTTLGVTRRLELEFNAILKLVKESKAADGEQTKQSWRSVNATDLDQVLLPGLTDIDFDLFKSLSSDLSKQAETWWETTHTDNLNHLDQVFKDSDTSSTQQGRDRGKHENKELRREIRLAIIMENLTITIVYVLFSEFHFICNQKMNSLKSLIEELEVINKNGIYKKPEELEIISEK